MTYLEEAAHAINRTHGVDGAHLETVPVREMFQGHVAWEGEVEVFAVQHPSGANRCYAWGYPSDANSTRREFVCVLGIGPVTSAETAVRAAIVAKNREAKNSG